MRFRNRNSGLSLAEVLMAMAVLSLGIAIFAPASIQKRMSADEAAALGGLKAIFNAAAAFSSLGETHRYPSSLAELRRAEEAYLDPELASGLKAGYRFTLAADPKIDGPAGFTAEAHPTAYRRSGVRSFFIDESGRVRAEDIGGFPGRLSMQPLDAQDAQEETPP